MQNVRTEVNGNELVIRVKLDEIGTPSKSGKTQVIASTRGNAVVPGTDNVKFGLNVYKPLSA